MHVRKLGYKFLPLHIPVIPACMQEICFRTLGGPRFRLRTSHGPNPMLMTENKDVLHLHSIPLMWSTAFELGLSVLIVPNLVAWIKLSVVSTAVYLSIRVSNTEYYPLNTHCYSFRATHTKAVFLFNRRLCSDPGPNPVPMTQISFSEAKADQMSMPILLLQAPLKRKALARVFVFTSNYNGNLLIISDQP